jgi:CRP-like cAMP-binding protein
MWALRQFPAFADIDLHELALVAENVSEVMHEAGDVVSPPGRALGVSFVIDGELAAGTLHWGARETFGLLEVLARREHVVATTATRATRTLHLDAGDLGDVLEEGFGVLRSMIHELAARVVWQARTPVHAIAIPAYQPLGLVDRLVVLRQIPSFASANLDALGALAHASEESILGPGTTLARAGSSATIAHVILDGSVHVTGEGRAPLTLGAGAVVGGVEVLGNLLHGRTYEASTQVRTLACSAGALFDVMEDHTELGLAVLERLASTLLLAEPA